MKQCKYCGKEFLPDSKQQVYCTKECRIKMNMEKEKLKRKKEFEKWRSSNIHKCEHCGSEFNPRTRRQLYCSEKCKTEVMRQQQKENRQLRKKERCCVVCGKSIIGSRKFKYCSWEPTKPKLSISEICKLALAEHLSYGKYVAKYKL